MLSQFVIVDMVVKIFGTSSLWLFEQRPTILKSI